MSMSNRKGAGVRKTGIFAMCLILVALGGCAAPSARRAGQEAGPAAVPVETPSLFNKGSADAVLLNEGISRLGAMDRPADYAKARTSFETLLIRYPQSRWRLLAETFLHILDDLQSARAGTQSDLERMKSENERLNREIQTLNDRFRAEHALLLQENEKLKQDIELLKKLEVQLDRREKLLR